MADTVTFSIAVENLQWIGGAPDDPHDLCAHGAVSVSVGGEVLRDACCVSASALRMLRTLTEDHAVGDPGEGRQMLPCCGHFMIAEGDNVYIGGCCYGTDYAVYHENDAVVIATEGGNRYAVTLADYRREVLDFARQVESFYDRCTPKVLPDEAFERDGYLAFRSEWRRRARDAEREMNHDR